MLHRIDGPGGLEVGPEQGLGMGQTDALGLGDPGDHATGAASVCTDPGVGLGVEDQGVVVVIGEGTAAHELVVVGGQGDALGLDEPFEGDVGLDVHGAVSTGRPVVGHPLYYD